MNDQVMIASRAHDPMQGIVDRALYGDAWSQARQWPAIACTVASLATSNGHASRRTYLHISFGPLAVEIALWGARFWEEGVPAETKPVDWLLVSPSPLASVEDALGLLRPRADLVTCLNASSGKAA